MTSVCVKLPEPQLKHLRKMSHFLSLERDADLSLSDLVREALDNTYPMPEEDEADEGQAN